MTDNKNTFRLTDDDRFTALFEQSPLSIQILSPDGYTLRVNKAWERLWGTTLEHIRDYNLLEDQQLVENGVMSYIKRGFAGETVQTPPILYDPDKTVPNLSKSAEPKRWTKAVVYPLRDKKGVVEEIMLIHEDITLQTNIKEESGRLSRQIENQRKSLQELVSQVPGVVWEAWGEPDEKDQRINFVSDHVEEMLGYSIDEWLSKPNFWLEIVHEEDKAAAASKAMEIFTGSKSNASSFRWIAKDGSTRWVEARSTVIRDENGTPIGLRGVTTDITDRKKKEESEKFLYEASAMLASSLDYETTLQTIAQLAVPHFADWCAIDILNDDDRLERLAIAHFDAEKVEWARKINAKYPAKASATRGTYQVARTGEPEFYPSITDEMLIESAHNEEHLEMMRQIGFRSAMIVPLKTRENILGVITFVNSDSESHSAEDLKIAEDLANRAALAVDNAQLFRAEQTTRKAAERNSELLKRLQSVSTALSQALTPKEVSDAVITQGINSCGAYAGMIVILNEKTNEIELVSAQGYRQSMIDQWKKFHISRNVPLADSIRNKTPIFIESFESYVERYPVLGPLADSSKSKAMLSFPLIVEGRTIGALGLSFLTRRVFNDDDRAFLQSLAQQCALALERAHSYESERRLRDEAEAANRLKDEFLATVSHELRTPLNAIVGWASLLKSKRLNSEVAEQAIETIERNAKSQAQIVEDLLDVSRIITGKLNLNLETIILDESVLNAVDGLSLAAQAKDIAIKTKFEAAGIKVQADRERLQQILWNLLSNAIKFTQPNGAVTIKLTSSESTAKISVIDNGIGIKPEFLPFVFDRFRQADGTTTRNHSGLGLGLSIVRYLVEMQDGTIQAESEGENKGSIFTVSFPLRSDINELNLSSNPESVGNGALLANLRVLIVDDDPDSLALLKILIEDKGGEAKTVKSAAEVLSVIGEFQPDILISDIGMPDEDGYALIKKLRLTETGAQIPAIALTAYTRETDRQQALRSGFQAHLTKPVDFNELLSAITRLLRN